MRQKIELIVFRAYAHLRSEAERTYIGILWWILDPIIFMLIFYVVFALLLQRHTNDFVSFLLVGLVVWRWFQNTVAPGSASIMFGKSLMNQVYLPKIIFPLVSIIADLFKFSLVFLLLLIYLWIRGYSPSWPYLALPLVLILQFTLIIGTTLVAAAFVPMLPDLRNVISHLLSLMLYLSGIFYDGTTIPERFRTYYYLNPMANLIEAYRAILLNGQWPEWQALFYVGLTGAVLTLLGYKLIAHFDHQYPNMALS